MTASIIDHSTAVALAFVGSVRQYGRIIFALLQREQENRRRAPLEAIMDVLEPLMFVALVGILWTFLNRRASTPLGEHPLLFIATGFYAKFFWICLSRLNKRVVGTPATRFPVERRLDYVFVHTIITTGDYLLLALVGFGVLYVFFAPGAVPHDFVPIIQAMLAIIALGFGWGMVTLIVSKYFWPWAYLAGFFNRAMIMFSGIFFLAEFLPPGPRYVLSFNPVLHAIGLFRTGFYPNYPHGLLDTTYLFYCALFALVLGFILERVTVRSETR